MTNRMKAWRAARTETEKEADRAKRRVPEAEKAKRAQKRIKLRRPIPEVEKVAKSKRPKTIRIRTTEQKARAVKLSRIRRGKARIKAGKMLPVEKFEKRTEKMLSKVKDFNRAESKVVRKKMTIKSIIKSAVKGAKSTKGSASRAALGSLGGAAGAVLSMLSTEKLNVGEAEYLKERGVEPPKKKIKLKRK